MEIKLMCISTTEKLHTSLNDAKLGFANIELSGFLGTAL